MESRFDIRFFSFSLIVSHTFSLTFIHRICMAFSGDGRPKIVAMHSILSAAKDVLSWNERKFRILKKIPFPPATALTIVPKSSSAKTTSAASFATSVPSFPIAMPISAAYRIKCR